MRISYICACDSKTYKVLFIAVVRSRHTHRVILPSPNASLSCLHVSLSHASTCQRAHTNSILHAALQHFGILDPFPHSFERWQPAHSARLAPGLRTSNPKGTLRIKHGSMHNFKIKYYKICDVSVLFSALYAKCPYNVVLYMQSVPIV